METLVVVIRVVHALYVAFVILAPALRWSGAPAGLGRLHLACLGFVTLQFACGWPCPLTRLEAWLAGASRPGSFIVPAAWTDAAATPVWAWLVLALLWTASLATDRVMSGHRTDMEAT